MIYTLIMKVIDFANNFRNIVGDETISTPENFVISGINWCFNELPLVPKLNKLFSTHDKANLDAKGHYKWLLNDKYRRLNEIPMLNFYTSTGGEPCKLKVCYVPTEDFYTKNGLIELKEAGIPCEYTIESEGDNIYLVFDRPLDVPIIVDYIVCGFPKPVTSMDDEIELSTIAEHLMMGALRAVWYQELDDFAFSGAIHDYLDNKYLPEAIQMLNKEWQSGRPIILGEN